MDPASIPNWNCPQCIADHDVTYYAVVMSDFSWPYAIRPMNFNVESVPRGYLPEYQDTLFFFSIRSSEQMNKDLKHENTTGGKACP